MRQSSVTPVAGGQGARVLSSVTARVTGLPAGAGTTVTIRPVKGFVVEVSGLPGTCTLVSTGTVQCRVTHDTPSATMVYAHPGQSLVLVFSIPTSYATADGQVTDPDAGNNTCTWHPRSGSCG